MFFVDLLVSFRSLFLFVSLLFWLSVYWNMKRKFRPCAKVQAEAAPSLTDPRAVSGLREGAASGDSLVESRARASDRATASARFKSKALGQDGAPSDRFFGIIDRFTLSAAGSPADMGSALGIAGGKARCSRYAPPSTVFRHLQEHLIGGGSVGRLADAVAAARWQAKLAASSSLAYASHLRMIGWGCQIFAIDPLRPGIVGIRRIAACVNNASTLSCWLSAWKCALEAAGEDWPGDSDPILKGIRRGTLKLQAPRYPRRRIRRPLVRRLLRLALSKSAAKWHWWAFLAIMAHAFALRMPSELFSQFQIDKLAFGNSAWRYGPIRRKHRHDWQFAHSFCLCAQDKFLCICSWKAVWAELDHTLRWGGFTPSSWTGSLRELLKELGVADSASYFGHDIRRGAAMDVFSEKGVTAMLGHCNWRSLGGAAPYVSTDEVQAGLLAQGLADESDPEC